MSTLRIVVQQAMHVHPDEGFVFAKERGHEPTSLSAFRKQGEALKDEHR